MVELLLFMRELNELGARNGLDHLMCALRGATFGAKSRHSVSQLLMCATYATKALNCQDASLPSLDAHENVSR